MSTRDIAGDYDEAVYPHDPPVYHYTYTVDDDYTGAKIFADEARDEHETHGMYEVIAPYNVSWCYVVMYIPLSASLHSLGLEFLK